MFLEITKLFFITMGLDEILGLKDIFELLGLNNILFGNRNTYTKIYIVL